MNPSSSTGSLTWSGLEEADALLLLVGSDTQTALSATITPPPGSRLSKTGEEGLPVITYYSRIDLEGREIAHQVAIEDGLEPAIIGESGKWVATAVDSAGTGIQRTSWRIHADGHGEWMVDSREGTLFRGRYGGAAGVGLSASGELLQEGPQRFSLAIDATEQRDVILEFAVVFLPIELADFGVSIATEKNVTQLESPARNGF